MECGITPENITHLYDNEVFVFGSNLAGHHGAGAAKTALQWGAIPGKGEGLFGQTYALPTKDFNIITRDIPDIYSSVVSLRQCIQDNPDHHFLITKVGCGLAGLSIDEVALMFRGFLDIMNCSLPQEFIDKLESK
ncbi:hypothetical protein LZD49_33575 [Dyadobacter sp. CY261]|uniref:A1S_2505 family phage non-structural protein n=1 Tax=Dyadobacter sp. CY261 TaxID=2907203 RepID=UPI001F2A18AE|nr:hypothetical protein [Dyadobacter sp. CY261]MCF0075458.1 hypothetical protein [Dyadobacter sp. CY261]